MRYEDAYQPELVGNDIGWALLPRTLVLTDPNLVPMTDAARSKALLTDAHPGKLGVARWIWEVWKQRPLPAAC
jgi:hypothetical protein